MDLSIFQYLQEERRKIFRLETLLSNKNKSPEEIQEQNELVDEKCKGEEIMDNPDYKGLMKDVGQALAYLYIGDVDFIVGVICGQLTHKITDKYPEGEEREKRIRYSVRLCLWGRNAIIKEIEEYRKSTAGTPQPEPSK